MIERRQPGPKSAAGGGRGNRQPVCSFAGGPSWWGPRRGTVL